MTELGFAGRTVAITGVGRRGQVGDQLSHAFAALGASVVLIGRTEEEVQARAAEVAGSPLAVAADLTNAEAVAAAVKRVEGSVTGGLHAVVHAAGGFAATGAVSDTDPALWSDMVAVNLTTAFLTARSFMPLLRRTRGSLLLFASAAALPGSKIAGTAAYAVAKSGVATLVRAIAQEEAQSGVRANALAPRSIRTPENEAVMGRDAKYVERDELVNAVIFLCSDESRAITGQVIALG